MCEIGCGGRGARGARGSRWEKARRVAELDRAQAEGSVFEDPDTGVPSTVGTALVFADAVVDGLLASFSSLLTRVAAAAAAAAAEEVAAASSVTASAASASATLPEGVACSVHIF